MIRKNLQTISDKKKICVALTIFEKSTMRYINELTIELIKTINEEAAKEVEKLEDELPKEKLLSLEKLCSLADYGAIPFSFFFEENKNGIIIKKKRRPLAKFWNFYLYLFFKKSPFGKKLSKYDSFAEWIYFLMKDIQNLPLTENDFEALEEEAYSNTSLLGVSELISNLILLEARTGKI